MSTDALFDVPAHAVDERVAAILELIAGDPAHARDRERIVTEIVRDGRANGGRVDLNRVRARLQNDQGDLTVYPRVIGAVVQVLARRKVLLPHGFVVNTDHRGGNAGRPLRAWRLANDTRVPIPGTDVAPTTTPTSPAKP